MTEEQKEQLNKIAKELGSVVEYWTYIDKNSKHEKVVIKYAQQKG